MYVAIKDSKIIAISDTDSKFICLVCDVIENYPEHTTSEYMEVDGEFLLKTDDRAIEKKKEQVKAVRSDYYDKYVDFYQSKPLLWAELTEEEKTDIADYRLYLKDYTNRDHWWESEPMDFETWKEQNNSDDVLSEVPENKGQSNESEVI